MSNGAEPKAWVVGRNDFGIQGYGGPHPHQALVGHDWGARAGYVIGALAPERASCLVALSAGYSTNSAPIGYALAHAYWYEWLVATERGRQMVRSDRRGFSRYLWQTWSPGWEFTDEDFDRAAACWDNDDWLEISISAYLHRWGEISGDPAYEEIERALAGSAPVRVPTLVIHGAQDGDNMPVTTRDKDELFTAAYERLVWPGVRHFPPREAPGQVAAAVLEWARR